MSRQVKAEGITKSQQEDFVNDFLLVWESVRKFLSSDKKKFTSWRNWGTLENNMFQDITLPFFTKWKDSGYFQFIEAYIKKFNSLLLTIEDFQILIPHEIILFESFKPGDKIYDRLRENPTLNELKKVLLEFSKDLNIPIRKTDHKIIQKLSNPRFSKSLDRFPKMAELAYGTRTDVRTVTTRLQYLFDSHILSLIYTIDMAKIGYQTIVFSHNTKLDNIPIELKKNFLFNFPTHSSQDYVAVLQYPYSNTKVMVQLKDVFNSSSSDFLLLLKQYRGWNFGGLTTDLEKRWKLRPPLLNSGSTWKHDLILGKTGLVSNLDPQFDPYELSYEEARLLGYIQRYATMDDASLEKQLKRSRKTIVADWKNLLQHEVIRRFPIFSNLGLGSWIYFFVSNLTPAHFRLVHQHFKFFPYSHVFFNELEGIIVGCVNIPLQWTHTFLYQLSSLSKEFPESKTNYYIGPDLLARWGINLMDTFHWKKFT